MCKFNWGIAVGWIGCTGGEGGTNGGIMGGGCSAGNPPSAIVSYVINHVTSIYFL